MSKTKTELQKLCEICKAKEGVRASGASYTKKSVAAETSKNIHKSY